MISLTTCIDRIDALVVEKGVSLELAQDRKANISEIAYDLRLQIPLAQKDSIPGTVTITFDHATGEQAVQLDFRAEGDQLLALTINGNPAEIRFESDHLILSKKQLRQGHNEISIAFIAGDLSLNRKPNFLYTLLVPDRAATLFPCFDQPDLKARFSLQLEVPASWSALANGAILSSEKNAARKIITFKETAPISTYLFAFTAGRFEEITREVDGRVMRMLYRESDEAKVQRNLDAIFGLHRQSIAWLEAYTAMPMPFEKFDFALIPGFQYGGMEHVGAIFYRESSLMLEENATENQRIGRASLIAHETAHIWFGDLVTMEWFSDVWLKEVFANFMAAKIVNPSFPEIDHELNFLLRHQPAAYGEDRSGGSHPIQQPLNNLREAGTLYGRIIYQKAPVVMRQLEAQVGEDGLRDGLREYLQRFAFANASWDDLIAILDEYTADDLKSWSEVWVKSAGMPQFEMVVEEKAESYQLIAKQASQDGKFWSEATTVALVYTDSIRLLPVQLEAAPSKVIGTIPVAPLAILPHASAQAYGYFPLDEQSRNYLLQHVTELEEPLLRGAAWISMYEDLLHDRIPVTAFYTTLITALEAEDNALNRNYLLGLLETIYWRFLDSAERQTYGAAVETLLRDKYQSAEQAGDQVAYFRTYYRIAQTEGAINTLRQIWEVEQVTPMLSLSETEAIDLTGELAIRLPQDAEIIIDQQIARTGNTDRKDRLRFLRPALSADRTVRDTFFQSLAELENRGTEPWVVDAAAYLHHPLRAATAIDYLSASLALMEEIQATGDIFFPRQFMTATLRGHQSSEAAGIVANFLEQRPDYPPRLRNKILMAADILLRMQR